MKVQYASQYHIVHLSIKFSLVLQKGNILSLPSFPPTIKYINKSAIYILPVPHLSLINKIHSWSRKVQYILLHSLPPSLPPSYLGSSFQILVQT